MAGNKRSVDEGLLSQAPAGERGSKKPRRASSGVALNPVYFRSDARERSAIQQAWRWVHVENGRGQLLTVIV